MPQGIVIHMRTRETVLEELLIILCFNVMHLKPYSGDMNSVAVRRKATVSIEDIDTDVAHALDYV